MTGFICDFKDARDDMHAVLPQLKTVQSSLEQLRDESTKIKYPEDFNRRFIDMIQNCDTLVISIRRVVDEAVEHETASPLAMDFDGEGGPGEI